MSDAETVHMFWHGGELPPLAQACMRSFASRGHRVLVHAYQPVTLPSGVSRADAREVLAESDPLYRLCLPGTIAAFADCFRYRVLFERGGWWMDTDVCCLTDELPPIERAWAEQEPGLINNAILRFPQGDPLAGRLADLARERARPGLRWGALGPELTTEVLTGAGDVEPAGTRRDFYPLHWREAHYLWLPEHRDEVATRVAGARFLHCWAQALENMGVDPWRKGPSGSYLSELIDDVPGTRALRLWHHAGTRMAIRRQVRQHRESERGKRGPAGLHLGVDGDAPLFDTAITRLRRSVVMPLRAARRGLRLPPGALDSVQHRIDSDRMFFIERAKRYGPVFKVLVSDSYTTCVVGHERGARLIAENESRLSGYTVDLEPLFPLGALRGMTGDTHRKYRRQFLHGIQAAPLADHAQEVRRLMQTALRAMADAPDPLVGDDLRDRLRRMSSAVMMRLLYGIDAGAPEFEELEAQYRRFGPRAPVNRIGDPQMEAFARIAAHLRDQAGQATTGSEHVPPCVLRHVARSGEADATTMGNLAYMFEPAHFDMYSLWHWILKLVAANPLVQGTYGGYRDMDERRGYAEAIVFEALRMEQSELLYWRVSDDIVFEGFLIPRGTTVRVCIWEGHKDAATFPDPFRFRPERFLENRYGLEAFAPFGLGQRRCLGANLVIDLSTMFVQSLLEDYGAERLADGAPIKGPYHWQPSPAFAVRLRRHAPTARPLTPAGNPDRPA